jgi:hypothetical protein
MQSPAASLPLDLLFQQLRNLNLGNPAFPTSLLLQRVFDGLLHCQRPALQMLCFDK